MPTGTTGSTEIGGNTMTSKYMGVIFSCSVKHLGQCFSTDFSAMMEVLHILELPHVYVSI